jgi:hypothetical protein
MLLPPDLWRRPLNAVSGILANTVPGPVATGWRWEKVPGDLGGFLVISMVRKGAPLPPSRGTGSEIPVRFGLWLGVAEHT